MGEEIKIKNVTQEELRFGQQMEKAEDKQRLIELVIRRGCKHALDLGAGTGFIAKQLSLNGIKADAVDCNFKTESYQNTELLTYYPTDLLKYVESTEKTYDCIILSAVLHELPPKVRKRLQKGLRRITDKNHCLILIREPYYEKMKDGRIRPYLSLETQKSIATEIELLTPEKDVYEFKKTHKLSSGLIDTVPSVIKSLNLVFTRSYGSQSWEREKHEHRFAFSKQYLEKWCKGILGVGIKFAHEIYDKDYKEYFKKAGYTPNVADGIEYTNCLLAAELGGE